MDNPLQALHAAGQAVWLDFVDRAFLASGGLKKLIANDSVTGVTSNPSIFQKAMGSGSGYGEGFAAFLNAGDASVMATYEAQAISDIQTAADDLADTYASQQGRDGYVSLEVSPYLAHDTARTIGEAFRLWTAVGRRNLMIKVPGTEAGVPAVQQLIESGLNVNVTLLFSVEAYEAVAEAYVSGLEARLAAGLPIDRIASVASFFISRIDTRLDAAIDARLARNSDQPGLAALRGQIATANAKLAYASFQKLMASQRWSVLAAHGAMPQRLLWASTGTKDPLYPDTLYVDGLIGRDTVNTMPPTTLAAVRDHGTVGQTLDAEVGAAHRVMEAVDRLGLNFAGETAALLDEGVRQFSDAFDALLGTVAQRRAALLGDALNVMEERLPATLTDAVNKRLDHARTQGWARRLWKGDATLWTGKDEGKWLGWLAAARGEQVDAGALAALSVEARAYDDAVLLGMGGSSLGPEVLALILGSMAGSPRLHVLDTTDPEQIGRVASSIDPARTLFIVSSKSGKTMEPELLRAFFFALSEERGGQFIAVTDPGSELEAIARELGFAHIFLGDPAIGGRYSVLSAFGMVPAAILGVDVASFYQATRPMVHACGPEVPPHSNPGVRLGVIMGEAANAGRDKLTILASPGLLPLGAWLEQLVAESTGKHGTGIVPVDLEPLRADTAYSSDRLFVHFRLAGEADPVTEARLADLAAGGHPVVTITIAQRLLIGQEFFRWEVATAIAGAVIGIDPFDQPDVEDVKIATRALVDAYEASGSLENEIALYEDQELAIFVPGDHPAAGRGRVALLAAYFATLRPGDYFGLLAYLERDEAHAATIRRLRAAVVDSKRVATVAGFGPRFLHSTGQAYKGGPLTGVFLEITRETGADIQIPGRKASFATVQLAQARGDLAVLAARGQRVMRIHLKAATLERLEDLVTDALLA